MMPPTFPETAADPLGGSFYVVLHDVAPCFADQIAAVADSLETLVGNRMAAAVVPCWRGTPMTESDANFVRLVQDKFGDVLLHGFTHARSRGRGLVSWITGGSDEFSGLTAEEAELRLSQGQAALSKHFDAPACGFIAPTFQSGRLTQPRLARHGLRYTVGFRHILFSSGRRIPIATWCWDMGRWRALGYAGQWYGNVRMRLYRNLLPCLAIHPVDVDRGFLPRIVGVVSRLLDAGRQPILFGNVPAQVGTSTL